MRLNVSLIFEFLSFMIDVCAVPIRPLSYHPRQLPEGCIVSNPATIVSVSWFMPVFHRKILSIEFR